MRLSLERTSVVLAGAWNHAIFTPEWVKRFLFPDRDVAPVVGMLPTGGLVTQFSADGVQLQVLPGRLELRFLTTPFNYGRMDELALACFNALPQTPVLAYGVNAGYDVPAPALKLGALFTTDDESALAAFGKVSKHLFVREVQRDGWVLVLSVSQEGGSFHVDLNHHQQIDNRSAEVAANLLKASGVRAAFDDFTQVLKSVYQLEQEGK